MEQNAPYPVRYPCAGHLLVLLLHLLEFTSQSSRMIVLASYRIGKVYFHCFSGVIRNPIQCIGCKSPFIAFHVLVSIYIMKLRLVCCLSARTIPTQRTIFILLSLSVSLYLPASVHERETCAAPIARIPPTIIADKIFQTPKPSAVVSSFKNFKPSTTFPLLTNSSIHPIVILLATISKSQTQKANHELTCSSSYQQTSHDPPSTFPYKPDLS